MKQEMMGWQWHQLDHTHFVYTSLQTENHANTSPVFKNELILMIFGTQNPKETISELEIY